MAKSIPALVEPSVLRWARETVGLIPVAAARKILSVKVDQIDRLADMAALSESA